MKSQNDSNIIMIRLFFKRVLKNKIYWLAVLSALVLLLCSVIYTEPTSGEQFTFLTLFYNEDMQNRLQYGGISIRDILMGYGAANYLGMFTPIIVGIPCVLNQKTERFMLFRGSKNGYFLSKYISNLVLGGGILVVAHLLFALVGIRLAQEQIWDIYMAQRFWDVFCDGVLNAIPGILLAEFIRNKYMILCIPFVWSYFFNMFVISLIPYELRQYILPDENLILFAVTILACGILIKFNVERRCDCGQK